MEILKVNVQEMERQKSKYKKTSKTELKKQWLEIKNKIKELEQLKIKE